MKYWTFNEVKDKVRRDLGLEQEEFVSNTELMGYVNSAIDEAEAEIIGLYQDYFLKLSEISLVSGQSDYDLPEDIYANKIRSLIYSDGVNIYPIRKFYNKIDLFHQIEIAKEINEPYYRYIIINNNADNKPVMRILPTPNETKSNVLKLWYTRNANRIESNTDKIDIPEFANFIIQYCKVRCYEKEGHPNTQLAMQKLEFYRIQMQETLQDMIPDGDDSLDPDLTWYLEST